MSRRARSLSLQNSGLLVSASSSAIWRRFSARSKSHPNSIEALPYAGEEVLRALFHELCPSLHCERSLLLATQCITRLLSDMSRFNR